MPEPDAARCIAILAPMSGELRPLRRSLPLRRDERGLYTAAVSGLRVVAGLAGVGTRAAERAAERVLAAERVDHLVVIGVAGGIGPSVAIGDLVVPERVLDLASGAERRPAPLGGVAPRGTLVTHDGLLEDRDAFARLAAQGAVAIDMETSAVALVCERHGCAWSVFRGISDRADDGTIDAAIAGLAGPDGRADLRALARLLLARPGRIPQLARLARSMPRAARVAAEAALRAIESDPGGGSAQRPPRAAERA
jgi:adenosylhomocysteine nucleosidase